MFAPSGKTHNARAFFWNDRYLMGKHPTNELPFITKYVEMEGDM